tara:strand:+ start:859 stop:1005 length:147 start_codon:yes stop_codon:yes gene_type:complete
VFIPPVAIPDVDNVLLDVLAAVLELEVLLDVLLDDDELLLVDDEEPEL